MNRAHWARAAAVCLVASCGHAPAPIARIDAPPNDPHPQEVQRPPRELPTTPPPEAAARGIAWLLEHQLPSGGWGQGDESPAMGSGADLRDVGDVADTCMATLALIRSGSTPRRGPHRDSVRRGVEFVIGSIERSDDDTLYVTDIRGTRVQSKIGQYVDTFAALNLLNEVRDEMPSPEQEHRMRAALAQVVTKIEHNQGSDGTWAQSGWAPTLGQALAARGLNREAQAGANVSPEVLRRTQEQAQQRLDRTTGGFAPAPPTAAGVEMYDAAAASSTMRQSVTTQSQHQKHGKQAHETQLERDAEAAESALVERLQDPTFVQGFGSNGGEEFLSYMLISETLMASGGERWAHWNQSIAHLLEGVQNGDGSWTGHHCITGRTFCTAAALLVMLMDRTQPPSQ